MIHQVNKFLIHINYLKGNTYFSLLSPPPSLAHATANVARPSVVGEDDQPIDPTAQSNQDAESDFWETSQGRFKFKLQDLAPHLQVIHTLLNVSNMKER